MTEHFFSPCPRGLETFLVDELKALGAHNLNPGRPDGLTGRARIRALVEAYEHFRQAAGLPATYQVVYGVLRRPD